VQDIPAEPAQADDSPAGTPQAGPGVIDEWVAWNIRIRRENLGWSQADLAKAMAALGWKYHPQTVHRIESGQRKVTIGEAEALARIFSVTVDALTWPDMMTHTAAWFGAFIERADTAFEQIIAQTRELLFAREHLKRAIAEVEGRGIAGRDEVRGAVAGARSVLESTDPEQAVEAGCGDHEEWLAGDPGDARSATGRDRFPRAPWLEEPVE
jgi:transcriptional regulator with XRE-family HTH domain